MVGHTQPTTTCRHLLMANADPALRVAALDSLNRTIVDDQANSMVQVY